ncbi:MAG TPA: AAA family ATPase [Nostocaceae cyanobacterium]|nr:AAA family ATPase [Nostocaceae cyanobacterium]
MTTLILLVGLPGSGKSTLAKQLLTQCPQMRLISTDAIRGQLFGSPRIQGDWSLIWQEIKQQFQQAVVANQGVIFDATNTHQLYRRELIASARNFGFTNMIGVWVKTPVWLCLTRNKGRSRQVPEHIIFQMHQQIQDNPPSLEDGLDQLIELPGKCSGISLAN